MLWKSLQADLIWKSNKPSLREIMERTINENDATMDIEKAGIMFEIWAQKLQMIESKVFQWTLLGAIQNFGSHFLKLSEILETVIDSIAKSSRITTKMVERVAILQCVKKDLEVLYEQYFFVGESNLDIRENSLNDITKFSTLFTNIIDLKRNFERGQIDLNLTDIINPVIDGLDELVFEVKSEMSRILSHNSLENNICIINTYIKLVEMSEEFKSIFIILKNGDGQNYNSKVSFTELDFDLDLVTTNMTLFNSYEFEMEEVNKDEHKK